MLCARYIKNATCIKHYIIPLERHPYLGSFVRCITTKRRNKAEEDDIDEERNRPIKFSTSKAAKWRAIDARAPYRHKPKVEALSLVLSLTVFLIYFCILREENDLDLLVGKSLTQFANERGVQLYADQKMDNVKK